MNEPSREELLEFMRKNYGEEWASESNLQLARMLWEKKYGGKYVQTVQDYQKVKISDLERGANYSVEGIILNIERVRYQGCPVCKRSVKRMCEHIKSKQTRPVWLTRLRFLVSDGTGELIVDGIFDEREGVPDIRFGDLVEVKGYVIRDPAELRMLYNGVVVKKRPEANNGSKSSELQKINRITQSKREDIPKDKGEDFEDDFEFDGSEEKNGQNNDVVEIPYPVYKVLVFLKRVGSMAERPLKRMVDKEGIKFEDLEPFVELDENQRYRVKSDVDIDKLIPR